MSDSTPQRLAAVRTQMAAAACDALIVPRADEYLGEYLPPHSERLRWLTGFTGSAGEAIVLADRAAIFVDGRYTVQVRRQVAGEQFEYRDLLSEPPRSWLLEALPPQATVACDARLHTLAWYRETAAALAEAGHRLVALPDNPVDACWRDRPMEEPQPALLLDERFSGESSLSKRRRIGELTAAAGADAVLVFAPDSVSWLLNIRGCDVPRTPVVQSMALLRADGEVTLVIAPERVPPGLAEHVGEGLRVVPAVELHKVLAEYAGQLVMADPASANAQVQLALEEAGATLLAAEDPVLVPRACKNTVELAGARRAHVRDAVAEVRFLAWLDREVAAGRLHDEAALSDRLLSMRREGEHFRDLSFDTISAAGPNAAMCHYNHEDGEPAGLTMDSVYLVDSGGQYLDGTTDITRTVAIGDPGPEVRRLYTLVLKGHIALDRARFPAGTSGCHLDALARQFLWREGFDYAHGTGHGVGAFLSVHEAPQRISRALQAVPLRPGMILSNEPGYYRDDAFGIRCENLVVVRECEQEQEIPMLEFEAITLVPFDNRLLDRDLLESHELAWLNDYHARVAELIAPLVHGSDRDWLQAATAPI